MARLFVYGSLKRGLENEHFLRGQTFLSEAQTAPVYRMYDWGGYPALVPVEEGGRSIEGEIWEISDESLGEIDILEDVDVGLYERATARLAPPHDEMHDVIVYHYARSVEGLRDVGTCWDPEGDSTNSRF